MTSKTITGLFMVALCADFAACTTKSSVNNDDQGTNDGSRGSGDNSSTGSGGSSSGGSGSGGSGSSTGGASGGSQASDDSTSGAGAGNGEGGEAGDPSGTSTGSGGSGDSNGSGGTDSAGSGGSSTTAAMLPTGDSCEGSEVEPNDDRNSATHYEIGWQFPGCLQSADDVDFYEFSVPDDDRGGVVTVHITDVGPDADTDVAVWSAADNGEFHSTHTNVEGASVFFYFNAKAGAAFRLEVTNYADVKNPNPYLLTVTYDQVPDEYEPNDTRPAAKAIDVGQSVEGYMFAGWENSTGVPAEDWFDWYSVDLEAGPASFLVDVVASDVNSEMMLYDPLGTEVEHTHTVTKGSSLLLEQDIEEAGTYFVRLGPYNEPATLGDSVDPPQYTTIPYTLTVTQ